MIRTRHDWLGAVVLVAAALSACQQERSPEGNLSGQASIEAAPREAMPSPAGMHTHTHADGTTHRHSHSHAVAQAGGGADHDSKAHARVAVGSAHPEHDPNAPCTCEQDIYHNTWCRSCNMGFIAGVPVTSDMLFETVDAHGHEIDPSTLTCATCKENRSTDGFCDACSMGFYSKQAYFTKLTHGIAQGTVLYPAVMQCNTCTSLVGKTGWCGLCAKGIVGNVAIRDYDLYQTTAPEFDVLLAAIKKTEFCEECACAMVMHRTCPKCRLNYASIATAVRSQ